MIRKILIGVMIAAFSSSMASAKKDKTAVIEDDVAGDTVYGWSMPIPKNWKSKSFNEPSVERLFLEKKNYMVNSSVKLYGGDYTIPSIAIYVQEFEGSTIDFENLIKKGLEEHRSDNLVISKLDILKDGEFIVSGDVPINSKTVRQVYLKRNYTRIIVVPDGSNEGKEKIINDYDVHEVYLLKTGRAMFVFQAYCEREFYDVNGPEFQSLLMSIKFSED